MTQPIEDTWNKLILDMGDVQSQSIFIWEVLTFVAQQNE